MRARCRTRTGEFNARARGSRPVRTGPPYGGPITDHRSRDDFIAE